MASEIYLCDALGESIVPIWTMRGDTLFCTLSGPSLNGTPASIPLDALDFADPLPSLLSKSATPIVAKALDFTKKPVWYNPKEHWLGWVPVSKASSLFEKIDDDLIGFLLDDDPVNTVDQYSDVYGYSSEDEHDEPREMYAGCYLDETWTNTASEMAKRLHSIATTLATHTEFYSRGPAGEMGPIPVALDEGALFQLQLSEEGAQDAVTDAKRTILSLLGFIAWFQSVKALITTKLSWEDQEFVKSLRLEN
jgi:hypothetical protein